MKRNIWAPLLLAALLLLGGCAGSDYRRALDSMESGDYAAALEIFSALGDYKDSAQRALDCGYCLAMEHYENGDHAEARAAFAALEGYRESEAYARRSGDVLLREKAAGLWLSEDRDRDAAFAARLLLAMGEEGESLLRHCDLSGVVMDMELHLRADGMFSETVSEESLRENMELLLERLEEGLCAYLMEAAEGALAAEGIGMEEARAALGISREEDFIAAVLGMSKEELFAALKPEETLTLLAETCVSEGHWAVEDGVLTLEWDDRRETAVYDEDNDCFVFDGAVYKAKREA